MKKLLFRYTSLLLIFASLVLAVPSCGHKHSYGEWMIDKEATCINSGSKTRVCDCGERETATIPAVGHTNGSWSIDAEATCIADGSKHQICAVCKDTIQVETIKSTGKHSYTSKVTTAATCTTSGVETFTCSACKDTYNEKISAKGHDWKAATCTSPKTCYTCNTTSGSALGHNKGSDGYCTRCYEKITIDMNTVVGNPNECETTSYFGFCYCCNNAQNLYF